MEQRPRVVIVTVFTCVVWHNMLKTHHGGADRASTPANEAVALQNEQVVYFPNENYRNHSREAKHQCEQLKDYFNDVGALAGQEDSFKTNQELLFKLVLLKISNNFPRKNPIHF